MFELQNLEVEAILEAGRRRAGAAELPSPDAPIGIVDLAALYYSSHDAETLRRAAIARRGARARALETFAPLYLTNTCDAECKMCGMRSDNEKLRRETVSPAEAFEQLEVLKRRGVLAVALLTGEYRGETRAWSVALTRDVLERAVELGFRHVLVNIGALEPAELDVLLAPLPRHDDHRVRPKVTMCTFQETYDREAYRRFMGESSDNPRANFERRLQNFDRAAEAGMAVVNPGVLLGLSARLDVELVSLALHVRHLLDRSLEVYVSLPRLRQATGASNSRGVSDDDFVRLIALFAIAFPEAKLVLTTRESAEVQRRVLSMVTVLSAGSSAVAPYDETGARFPLEASQFEVIDQRPIETILGEYMAEGYRFENFVATDQR